MAVIEDIIGMPLHQLKSLYVELILSILIIVIMRMAEQILAPMIITILATMLLLLADALIWTIGKNVSMMEEHGIPPRVSVVWILVNLTSYASVVNASRQ